MIPQHEITALEALIERMDSTAPLTPLDIFYKERERRPDLMTQSREQAKRIIERTKPLAVFAPRDRKHPIHGDTFYSLGFHVSQLDAYFNDWIAWAHFIPPHHAERIAANLKRAKRTDLRDDFVASYSRHEPPLRSAPEYIPPPADPDELHAWALQQSVPRLIVRAIMLEDTDTPGQVNVQFDFCCRECGGAILHLPDDNDENGPAVCKACGIVFGTYGDVRALCQKVGALAARDQGMF